MAPRPRIKEKIARHFPPDVESIQRMFLLESAARLHLDVSHCTNVKELALAIAKAQYRKGDG